MIEEFVEKLNNNEYISNHLYEYVQNNNSSVIPIGFNIDNYNNKNLDKLYNDNKEYFANMYKGIDDNIHLDEEQCKAILADEKYSLIIAGAGTGKTTTMVSKVKYLVDKKNADPERILVMSYTRKATEEIANRIENNYNIPVHVTTFHSLGFEYIREIFEGRKCTIVDRNKLDEIKTNFFRKIYENKNNIKEIIKNFDIIKEKKNFIFSRYFLDNYEKYNTYDEFVDAYVNHKTEEAHKSNSIDRLINDWVEKQLLKDEKIISLKGEYVKSAGELVIANFLYSNGLDYSYEEIYDELMENGSIYRPDFTIDYAGEKIYIEYYGLDDNKYNKIREWKRDFHRKSGNKYIEINRDSLDQIIEELNEKLNNYGVKYKERSKEEIYEHILRLNPISQVYPFLSFLQECMTLRKESHYRDDFKRAEDFVKENSSEENNQLEVQYKYIMDYERFYAESCYRGSVYYFDFSDLLYYSVKYIEMLTTTDAKLLFDYIIIDEYQDISQIKYELTYKTAKKNDAKVYAVGDDWQSIYSFSGSRIEYIYRFKEFFKGAKIFNITKTYRNSQELIDITGDFIMKNEFQIKKQLISEKHLDNPIVIKTFNSNEGHLEEIKCLKETIKEIHKENPDYTILVLGRTNRIINRITNDEELIDDIGSKIVFKGNEDIKIDGMTMHKAKGLTFDEVILIGLNKYWPHDYYHDNWYEELYKNKPINEPISFPEERRLFYVALTRTKNKVYLLAEVDENKEYTSAFVREIKKMIDAKKEQ